MRYAYLLTKTNFKDGPSIFVTYDLMLRPDEVLQIYKKEGYKKCKFWSIIPYGMHLCACGKVTMGSDEDLLCKSCQEVYGHKYAHQL